MIGRTQLQCDGINTEGNFCVQAERVSPHSLTTDKRHIQFSLLLAAGFCLAVAHNKLTNSNVLSFLTFLPSFLPRGLCHQRPIKFLSNYMELHLRRHKLPGCNLVATAPFQQRRITFATKSKFTSGLVMKPLSPEAMSSLQEANKSPPSMPKVRTLGAISPVSQI